MRNWLKGFFVRTLLMVGVTISAGCSTQDASPSAGGGETSDAWKAGLDEDVVSALSQLSDADRTAALAQQVCPVSDEPLGSMGAPPKVTIEGQDVFICCAGCEEELRSKPDEYLAKLKAAE
jgi:hypothetical protein